MQKEELKLHWDNSTPQRKTDKLSELEVKNSKSSLVITPLIVLFVTLFGMIVPLGLPFKKIDGSEFRIALTTGYLFVAVSLDASIYVCIGAVLSGGLFGDHCSPISDTTILSSTGVGCDLIDHVKTQLPYAILNGAIAFITYLIVVFINSELSLIIAIVMLISTIFTISKMNKIKIKKSSESTINQY